MGPIPEYGVDAELVNEIVDAENAVKHVTSAKAALERVCSGTTADASRYYSPEFRDHVNDHEYVGLAGVEQSVARYRKIFDEMAIEVLDQHAHGDYVTSRFAIAGMIRGKAIRFNGITISRFEDGLIVEDWSVTDTLGFIRQLGLRRLLLVMMRSRR